MKREAIIQELRRIGNIEWMRNVECNCGITLDLFDIKNERWFGVFYGDERIKEMTVYGQSAKYPGGAKWKIENLETSTLEYILKHLRYIEKRGNRLPFPEPGYYHDHLNNRLNHTL